MAKMFGLLQLLIFGSVWISVTCQLLQKCMTPRCSCCKDRVCRSDDFCTTGCIDGIWGNRCYLPCPDNCVACTQGSHYRGKPCTSCITGKYGDTCKHTCAAGCDGATCDIDGSCTCIAGYSGDKCDIEIVVCPDNCLTCTSHTICQTCVDGYSKIYRYKSIHLNNFNYTTVCKHYCKIRNCKTCTGSTTCTMCDDGYYGEYCEYKCSSGCQTGICIKENGNCNCKPGFKGENCDQCIAGKYSDDCSQNCLSQNCMNNVCIRDSGRCTSCSTWYYGNDLCDKSCSTSCKYGTCDFTLGTCASGCITGYSGDKCCLNNDRCIKCSSPSACLQCIGGYKGDLCDCPVNCLCTGKCGSCDGNFGNTNINCTECALHKYGEFCQSSCNNNCLDNDNNTKCHVTNGTCLTGCVNGFYGDKCDSPCNGNCVKGTCSRPDGLCSYGCKHGSTQSGAECVIAAVSSDADDGGTSGAVIGGSVFAVVVMLAIIAGVLVFVFLRRRSKDNVNIAHTYENTGHEDNDHNPNDEAVLAEVDEGYEIPISNPGTSAAEVETTHEYEEPDEVPQHMQRPGLSADHDGEGVVIEIGNINTYEKLSRPEINPDTYSTINTYESLSRPETNADVYSQLEQSAYEDTTI